MYIYISIIKVCFALRRFRSLRRFRMLQGFVACLARNVAICCIWLHLAARAWPGAADRSKWLLEPAPEPQIARNCRSSPPQSRRILEKCRSSLPWSRRMLDGCRSSLPRNRRMLDGCRSSHPGGAECSTGAARACPGAAACSKSAARAHSREVRSFLAFEMAARKVLPPVRLLSASAFARLHFASCMLCTGSH